MGRSFLAFWRRAAMEWKVEPHEDPDWGYARNRLFILKTPLAEYSASVYTAPLETPYGRFYGPNRDYSWQGLLLGPHGGRIYKLLDAVYFLPDRRGKLDAVDVSISPSRCVYTYRREDGGAIRLSYTLSQTRLGVDLRVDVGEPCKFAVLLDCRDAETWDRSDYGFRIEDGRVHIRPSGAPFSMVVQGFDGVEFVDLEVEWVYKLGDGFRRLEDGVVKFIEHRRLVRVPVLLHSKEGIIVHVPTSQELPEATEAKVSLPGAGLVVDALRLRVENLSRFSTFIDGLWVPEAGSWWFRRPWTRDILEGLRWNLKTYVEVLGWGSRVRRLLIHMLETLSDLGGLPMILGSSSPFSSDAPPQLIYVSSTLSEMTSDRELMRATCCVAELVSRKLLRGMEVSGTRLVDGVLCCPANSSWIDSVMELHGVRWPLRLPVEWMGRVEDPFSSSFALVEVNAMYVEALRRLLVSSVNLGLSCGDHAIQLAETLVEGFKKWFLRDGLPPLTVSPELRLVDGTVGSPSVQAVSALLDTVYDLGMVRRCWNTLSKKLLVYRRLVRLGEGLEPFGLLVRDVERRPYLGDLEYHGPTVWPRDTPYLISLMERLGMDVAGILVNNLDHMVSEGAVGYCSELFSLPVGSNPSPGRHSLNPVPVKNPAQYWSHWCDPYLRHLEEVVRFGVQ